MIIIIIIIEFCLKRPHLRHCDLSRGNKWKKERERERACVYVNIYSKVSRTRVKMYDLSVQGVQEKGVEIRILFCTMRNVKIIVLNIVSYTHNAYID